MNKAFRRFGGLVMALGLIAAGVGFTSAPTSVPTMPIASASISTWQAWSSAEVQYVTTTNWAQVLPSEIGSGQQLVNWGIVSTTSTGAGIIPAGITTDNLWYLTQPDSPAQAATNSVAAPTTYPSDCNSATDGEICIAQTSSAQMEVQYTNETSNSIIGHLELSLNSSQCAPGTLLADSPTETIPGGYVLTMTYDGANDVQNVGTIWEAQDSGPYHNYGNVCITP